MKVNTDPMFPDRLYNIYNRGNNGENIFIQERNYRYFLDKYVKFIYPIADLWCYCLLKNHFHFLVSIKPENQIRKFFHQKNENFCSLTADQLISKAFNSFFKSYALSINKTYGRTGRLLEEPFRRVEVTESEQITTLINYIHLNPVKHGFTRDYASYPYSSYQSLTNDDQTFLARDTVLDWFGNRDELKTIHESRLKELNHELRLE